LIFEPVNRPFAGIKQTVRDLGSVHIGNAVVAFLFSSTGPVAIIISVGIAGGLTQGQIGSWIFTGCVVGGVLTIWFSCAYRQPLSFAWTIPGTVLLASALDHLSFAEVIGAYWATAVLIGIIGVSGTVSKAIKVIPMPIVLAMVSGIFLQFGLDAVLSFEKEFVLASAMVIAYVAVLLVPGMGVYMPPVVMALLAGITVVIVTGNFSADTQALQWLNLPAFEAPEFSRQAIFELMVPLAVTVLVAQNAQGFAVLLNAGHNPPVNNMTFACALGSGANALFGAVSTCVTGPANAVLVSGGETSRQYSAGVLFGVLSIVFGILAFAATWLILKLPPQLIAVLCGLALLPVLQKSFVGAFAGRFSMSALVTLVITVSGVTIWNIGSPFWGLVTGMAFAILIENTDYREYLRSSKGKE